MHILGEANFYLYLVLTFVACMAVPFALKLYGHPRVCACACACARMRPLTCVRARSVRRAYFYKDWELLQEAHAMRQELTGMRKNVSGRRKLTGAAQAQALMDSDDAL